MSKKINLKPLEAYKRENRISVRQFGRCKAVILALCGFITLFSCNTSRGQTGHSNPFHEPICVHAKISIPTPNGSIVAYATVPSPPCSHYRASMPGQWNGKYSNKGVRLSNIDTSNISFPFLSTVKYNNQNYNVNVNTSNVDAFWENNLFSAANGYSKISGASIAMNCHVHSTGLGYWVNDFDLLMDGNYDHCFFGHELESGVLFGFGGHSAKIAEVTISGASQYTVTKVSQKYGESGVYEKTINQTFAGNDLVKIGMTIVNIVSGNYDILISGFYRKK